MNVNITQILENIKNMSCYELSKYTSDLFKSGDKKNFKLFKELLFQIYEKNYLAYFLLKTYFEKEQPFFIFKQNDTIYKVDNKLKRELSSDINRYFKQSYFVKYYLYCQYGHKINKENLNNFKNYLEIIKSINLSRLEKIYIYGLGDKFEYFFYHYLNKSTTKIIDYIDKGSTCEAIRIGDYVIKIVIGKWSYENIICPNLYLIAKNLEEEYVRDEQNIVIAGIEIQQYLKRAYGIVDHEYFIKFEEELNKLGYFINDSLVGNTCVLSNYLEADIKEKDIIPEWFKQIPIVLVDRDRIYSANDMTTGNIKQQKQLKR
mgnify:FL=1